jgi:hypothetical protein
MSLIDETYFIGELNIPNTDRPAVSEALTNMISIREKELLTDLLGYDMYKLFLASPTDPRWADLKNGKEYTVNGRLHKWEGLIEENTQSLIANYVYYWWIRNEVSKTSGIGEVRPVSENAVNASPADKMVKAWNQMSDKIRRLFHFLYNNADTYPEWDFYMYWTVDIGGFNGWYNPYYSYNWKYGYINSMNT